MRGFLTVLLVISGLTMATSTGVAEDQVIRTVKGGILDEAKLYVDKLPPLTTVVIHPLSATDADLVNGDKKEETKKMQVDGPKMFADEFVAKLVVGQCYEGRFAFGLSALILGSSHWVIFCAKIPASVSGESCRLSTPSRL